MNVERRRWDLQEYEKKAVEEARKKAADTSQTQTADGQHTCRTHSRPLSHCPLSPVSTFAADVAVVAKAPLRARESTPLNLSATLGKSILVAANTPLAARGGYYCDVCTCLLKDSQTYLDHINGRKHQKKLGMTMKINKVDVEEVRDRMRQWAEKKEGERGDEKGREAGRKRKREAGAERKDAANDDSEEDDEHTADAVKAAIEKKEPENDASDASKERNSELSGEVRPAALDRGADDDEESMMAAMGFQLRRVRRQQKDIAAPSQRQIDQPRSRSACHTYQHLFML